jgi:hypothetical protein
MYILKFKRIMSNYRTKANRIGIESLDTLGQRVIDTVNSSVVEEAKKTKYFLLLVDVNTRFSQALMPPVYREYTSAINSLHKQCEDGFLDIYDYLKGLQKSPDAEISAAAVTLFRIVSQFGRKYVHLKDADRTSRYGRIIDELQKEENAGAVTKTLLAGKLAAFASFHQEHETLFRKRGNIRSVNISASKLRAEMQEAAKMHLEELQWLTRTKNTEEWRVLCRNVEERFDEMNVSRTQKAAETTDAASQQLDSNNTTALTV